MSRRGADYDLGRVERAGHATLNARAGGTPSPARPDLPGRLLTLWCRSCGGEYAWDYFGGQRLVAGVHGRTGPG